MKILDVVDSIEYSSTNCYQHQLQKTLHCVPEITTVQLRDLHTAPKPDIILSRLKQRTLHRIMHDFSRWAGNVPIFVYDQDPWHAFIDGSPYKGVYHDLSSILNVSSYLVTSRWWCDHIKSENLPATFVNMWLLPEYCDPAPAWADRKIDIGFCGQLHTYRRKLFEELSSSGINVHIFPPGDYQHYLRCLSQTKIFVHSEQVDWAIDGISLDGPHALWIKDIEAAGRGCISIRNTDRDTGSYASTSDVPTIMTYDTVKSLVGTISEILSSDPAEINERTNRSVEFIKTARGWNTVIDSLRKT